MDGLNQLAKMFKERNNVPYLGPQVGTVVSVSPLTISLEGTIVLTSRHLIVAAHLLDGYTRDAEVSGDLPDFSCTIEFAGGLQVGEEVIMVPSTDEQRYFVIDKVVRV